MKTSSQVIDAINALESKFPVAAWRAGDIDLWPAYRLRLYVLGAREFLVDEPPSGSLAKLSQLARRASRALWRVPLAALRDRRMNARLERGAAAVFLSDGVSFVRVGDAWYDRVIDPVIEALATRGRTSLKLTPLSEAHVPRRVPSWLIQPHIDRIKLTASGKHLTLETPQFEALHADASRAMSAPAPDLEWLRVQAARLDALARWFGALLRESGGSHAFVNTYYSLEGLAFVQAARRLGMRTVDLQHGLQGPHHVAYARWASAPDRGYSTLPDEFWVWSEDEARVIDAWRGRRDTHVPRVSGNFWLDRWRDETDPLVARVLARARALRSPGLKQVLVCLTWGVPEEENLKLIEAARLCKEPLAWWWRLHPVRASESEQFARLLEQRGLDGRHVKEATDLPLYALLRAADVTLAHSSTVISEAAELGVPSVVTSDYGAEFHGNLVRSGVALHATALEEIAAAVVAQAARAVTVEDHPSARGSLQALADAAFPLSAKGSLREAADA